MYKIKLLSILTAAVLFIAAIQSVFALQPPAFTDVNGDHPNYEAINDLKTNGVIGGYPDGTFKPDQEVNRVEVLKMIFEGLEMTDPSPLITPPFQDVDLNQWYGTYLYKAYTLGIIEGYKDGTFKPERTVNVVENLKLILEASKVTLPTEVTEDSYADTPKSEWYAKYVQYAKENTLIDADSNNKVYPGVGMTRGDFAEALYRLRNVIAQETPAEEVVEEEGVEEEEEPGVLILGIRIEDSKFSPDVITIGQGTKLNWTNLDSIEHTVTSDDGIFDSGNLGKDEVFGYTFDTIDTFTYHCSIHPSMTGTVVVKPANEVPTI